MRPVKIKVGQTWCYQDDEGEPGRLFLILALEPDGVVTGMENATLLNLETGETHTFYPTSHFLRGNTFWRRVT